MGVVLDRGGVRGPVGAQAFSHGLVPGIGTWFMRWCRHGVRRCFARQRKS